MVIVMVSPLSETLMAALPVITTPSAANLFEGVCYPETSIEREVKFATTRTLLSRSGIELERLPKTTIEQRYFNQESIGVVAELYESRTGATIPDEIKDDISQARIRRSVFREEVTYELTMKTPRNSLGMGERIELPPVHLSSQEYRLLSTFATAGLLIKDRYELPTPERLGVTVALDVVRSAGLGDASRGFGKAGWEVVTIDVEAESPAALGRLIRDPGSAHPCLESALMLEDHPRLRGALGATKLARGDSHGGKGHDGQRGRFEKGEREVRRLLRRSFEDVDE